MNYLCSECSVQLNKFEIELNTLYPIGKLYCEFCQNKKEREIIKKIADSEKDMHNDYIRDLLGVSHKLVDKGDNIIENKVYSEKEFDENN